jgi:hypothetical protein
MFFHKKRGGKIGKRGGGVNQGKKKIQELPKMLFMMCLTYPKKEIRLKSSKYFKIFFKYVGGGGGR